MSGDRHATGFGEIDMGTVERWRTLDPAIDVLVHSIETAQHMA